MSSNTDKDWQRLGATVHNERTNHDDHLGTVIFCSLPNT
jgi:hypothetical protein